jgi:hypothetical protein
MNAHITGLLMLLEKQFEGLKAKILILNAMKGNETAFLHNE